MGDPEARTEDPPVALRRGTHGVSAIGLPELLGVRSTSRVPGPTAVARRAHDAATLRAARHSEQPAVIGVGKRDARDEGVLGIELRSAVGVSGAPRAGPAHHRALKAGRYTRRARRA